MPEFFPILNGTSSWKYPVIGLSALAVVALPATALAHHDERTGKEPGKFDELIADGLKLKRAQNTGKGMPSVMGPFPDTVNMTFLGQLTNEDGETDSAPAGCAVRTFLTAEFRRLL